jgi:hypothetical protein
MGQTQPDEKLSDAESPANLREEYRALSDFFNQLIAFRLTLLGFFIAGIGLIVGGEWPINPALSSLGLLLTFSLYIFELRTRILFSYVARRATYIEQEHWGFGDHAEKPLYSRQFPNPDDPIGTRGFHYAAPIKILGLFVLKARFFSHSFALDLLYIGIMIFFAASIMTSLTTPAAPALSTGTATVTSPVTLTATATPTTTLTPSPTAAATP